MRIKRWFALTGAALAVTLAAVGCAPIESDVPVESETTSATSQETSVESVSTPPATPEDQPAAAVTALAALENLEVKGRAPRTGYEREEFGPAWADTDHNGCDTRNDMLARDLAGETYRPGTQDCVVLTGVLDDPFTATEIHFVRGQDTSTMVQIDHVVALSDAWQKGAQQLDVDTRREFSNDPLNLLAVDGPANSQKGDGDAATWLPPNRAFRCDYVSRQIAVKDRYDLWVTSAEKDAMARVLNNCPDQELPTDQTAAVAYEIDTTNTLSPVPPAEVPEDFEPSAAPQEPAAESEAPVQPAQLPSQSGTDPQFSSCAKAKDAGFGPYVSGVDPEYGWYRDGDSDGINCE